MRVPGWIKSQRRDRYLCEVCGDRAVTEWAGTGELLCWVCCEVKRSQG